ncbi:hypothetical protein C8Q79DRAFT_410963 [Trametes meyenii]|nr:hypothetical protein C8Q79DRAFT_410963 [Trametes meyenii]
MKFLERWFLLNIDSRQNALDLWGRLQFCHLVGPVDPLNTRLIDSLREQHLPLAYDELLKQGRPTSRQHGLLGKLPVEMLGMIFDELPSRDALCFAVTCKLLLAAGKRRLTQTLSDRHASWRGDRLIYLGDNAFGREGLPAGLLTDAEWDEVVQDSLAGPSDEERDDFEDDDKGKDADKFVDSDDENYDNDSDDSDSDDDVTVDGPRLVSFAVGYYEAGLLCDAPFTARQRGGNALAPLISEIQAQSQASLAKSSGDDHNTTALEPWSVGANDIRNLQALWDVRYDIRSDSVEVVCNLSKGEYIRADGFTLTPYPVDLGQALLARIAWSTSANGVVIRGHKAFLKELTRGPWAGDRFAVTTIDALPALARGPGLPEGGEWRDTTAGVDRLLAHVYDKN